MGGLPALADACPHSQLDQLRHCPSSVVSARSSSNGWTISRHLRPRRARLPAALARGVLRRERAEAAAELVAAPVADDDAWYAEGIRLLGNSANNIRTGLHEAGVPHQRNRRLVEICSFSVRVGQGRHGPPQTFLNLPLASGNLNPLAFRGELRERRVR